MTIAEDSVWTFDILVTGAKAGMAKTFCYRIIGAVENAGGTTTIKNSTVELIDEADDSSFGVRVQADDSANALLVQVQDADGDTIRWVADVRTCELTFA